MKLLLLALVHVGAAQKTQTVSVEPSGATSTTSEISKIYDGLTSEGSTKPSKAMMRKLNEAVAASPQDAKALAALGFATLRTSKTSDDKVGVRKLKDALALAPTLQGLQLGLANVLQERARRDVTDRFSHKEALDLYTGVIRLAPTDGAAYYQLGRLHELRDGKDRMGKPEKGFDLSRHIGSEEDVVTPLWRTAMQAAPGEWRAARDLSVRLSQSHKKAHRKEAIELAEKAAGLAPQSATAHAAVAAAHVRQPKAMPAGRLTHDTGTALGAALPQRRAAARALQRSIRTTKEKHAHADAYYELGVLLHTTPAAGGVAGQVEARDLKASHRAFQEALALRPGDQEFEIAELNTRQMLAAGLVRRDGRGVDDDDDEEDD